MAVTATAAEPIADIGALAGLYSQLSGVLAGFAFTALIIYLGRERDEPDPTGLKRAVSVALFSALTSLIIVAILYTVLAGAADKPGPALTGTLVYGLPFGLSVLALFHAITLQALPYRYLHGMTQTAVVIVGVIGPTIVMALIAGAVIDLHRLGCASVPCDLAPEYALSRPLGWGLFLTGILAISSLAIRLWLPRLLPFRTWMSVVPTYMVLGVSIAAIVGAVVLTAMPSDWRPANGPVMALLTITFLLLLAFSTASVLALRLPHKAPTEAGPAPVPPQPPVEQASARPR